MSTTQGNVPPDTVWSPPPDSGGDDRRDGRRRRRWLLLLPVLLTLAIGAGVSGWVAYQGERKSDEVRAVDDVGAEYLSDVATFRDRISSALAKTDPENPTALRATLKSQLRDLPQLRPMARTSAEQSATYREAKQTKATLLAPYRKLDQSLQAAQVRKKFIDAGSRALALDPAKYVSSTSLDSSSELRSRLLPTFNAERVKFAAVRVPKGGQDCAQAVLVSLDQIIGEATKLADSIDAVRTYETRLGTQGPAAAKMLAGCKTRFDGDLAEALDSVNTLAG